MAEKLEDKELAAFKEMLMANSIQADALRRLLIEKEMITEEEFQIKLTQPLYDYQEKGQGKMGGLLASARTSVWQGEGFAPEKAFCENAQPPLS
jgi:hypothetical protein